jgi:hypothetical protein
MINITLLHKNTKNKNMTQDEILDPRNPNFELLLR